MRLGVLSLTITILWFYTKRASTSKDENENEKVLVTVLESQVSGLDPVRGSGVYDAQAMGRLYDGLLEYHYLKRPFELVPNLAAAMPTVSEDGLVYTFEIKQGVKFHDNACFPQGQGRELVAEDFIYSIKRVADPKIQSPSFSMIAERIEGLDAWRDKYVDASEVVYDEAVTGLRAIDKYTLQFTLTKPWPQFMCILAMPVGYAVPQEAVRHYGAEFINHPVGTGPFMLQEFNPQLSKLQYYKNPTFRDKRFPSEAAAAYQPMLADAGKNYRW